MCATRWTQLILKSCSCPRLYKVFQQWIVLKDEHFLYHISYLTISQQLNHVFTFVRTGTLCESKDVPSFLSHNTSSGILSLGLVLVCSELNLRSFLQRTAYLRTSWDLSHHQFLNIIQNGTFPKTKRSSGPRKNIFKSKVSNKQTPGKAPSEPTESDKQVSEHWEKRRWPETESIGENAIRENSIVTAPWVSLCSGNKFSFRCESFNLKCWKRFWHTVFNI